MRVLLGVSGGVAAYKSVEFVRLAMRAGHGVRVLQTRSATRFVGRETFSSITGAPVLIDVWDEDPLRGAWPGEQPPAHVPIPHLALAEAADVLLVAPATANTLARLAHGLADDALSTAALAFRGPVLIAPAMNAAMLTAPAVQTNLRLLAERGAVVLPSPSGQLGSPGEWGVGRLAEPADLLGAVETAGRRDLSGLRLLVTAGGTREPIDAVRFVGNRSSGRMGVAVAEAAARRGAHVTLVAANVELSIAPAVDVVRVHTAEELRAAAGRAFPDADVLIMAAAVADLRPAMPQEGKLKKAHHPDGFALELVPTVDVLAELSARRRPRQTLVGFAAEHGPGAEDHARGKLARKGLDLVVLNDVSQPGVGFESPRNEVTLIRDGSERRVTLAPKAEIADHILDEVRGLRHGHRGCSDPTPTPATGGPQPPT